MVVPPCAGFEAFKDITGPSVFTEKIYTTKMNTTENLDYKKLAGIRHLAAAGWPALPTFVVREWNDIRKLPAFYSRHKEHSAWFLRSLQPIPVRYQVSSIAVSDDEMALIVAGDRNSRWQSMLPFCIQPYIESRSSGVAFLHRQKGLVEFARGNADILRGNDLPNRCVVAFSNGLPHLNEVDTGKDAHMEDWLLSDVMTAMRAIPKIEIENDQSVLVEWVATSNGNVYFVDYQQMPADFLKDFTPLAVRPKTVWPGNLDFPLWVWQRNKELPRNGGLVLAMERPHVEAITTIYAYEKDVRGVVVKEGSWLSHLSRFVAERRLPCLIGLGFTQLT